MEKLDRVASATLLCRLLPALGKFPLMDIVAAVAALGALAQEHRLALFRLLSPLERRPLPWWDATVTATGRRATTAGALVCAAGVVLVVMAKFGLGDHTGWAACAAFLSAALAARVVSVPLLSSSPLLSTPTRGVWTPHWTRA